MPVEKTKTYFPLSLDEAKRHLRVDVDYNEDDDYINDLIYAATREAENYIGKDIALTSNVANIFKFSGDDIRINEGNCLQVNEVISDSSTLIVPAVTKIFYNYFEVELSSYINYTNEYVPLQVKFDTGYDAGDCPQDIKQAILIKIANMYDVNREDSSPAYLKDSYASNNLLNSYKQILF